MALADGNTTGRYFDRPERRNMKSLEKAIADYEKDYPCDGHDNSRTGRIPEKNEKCVARTGR